MQASKLYNLLVVSNILRIITPILGEMIQFEIFFNWVRSTIQPAKPENHEVVAQPNYHFPSSPSNPSGECDLLLHAVRMWFRLA